MAGLPWGGWKTAAIGVAVVVTTVVVTTLVVGNWGGKTPAPPPESLPSKAVRSGSPARGTPPPRPVATSQVPASAPHPGTPTAANIQACNEVAAQAASSNKTQDVLTKAVIGGALGAGVGAAGGGIAAGGKGAGKGAAIGGLVGAAAGTLYGLNEVNQKDEQARAAYRSCMRDRGYAG